MADQSESRHIFLGRWNRGSQIYDRWCFRGYISNSWVVRRVKSLICLDPIPIIWLIWLSGYLISYFLLYMISNRVPSPDKITMRPWIESVNKPQSLVNWTRLFSLRWSRRHITMPNPDFTVARHHSVVVLRRQCRRSAKFICILVPRLWLAPNITEISEYS